MLTTTHVAIAGTIGRALDRPRIPPDRRPPTAALALGGLLPDVALLTAMVGTAAAAVVERRNPVGAVRELLEVGIGAPVLEFAHVALHAPLVGTGLLVAGFVLPGRTGRLVRACAVGILLHVAVDVATHVDDGPLLLFPLDRTTTVASPVSWHDPTHWGWLVLPIDVALSIGLGGWLLTGGRPARDETGPRHP